MYFKIQINFGTGLVHWATQKRTVASLPYGKGRDTEIRDALSTGVWLREAALTLTALLFVMPRLRMQQHYKYIMIQLQLFKPFK